MTTQKPTNLTFEQAPYGYTLGLDLMSLAGKTAQAIKTFFAALDEAVALRNRYAQLDSLGADRATISQTVAQEAGLVTPVADNNNEQVRKAA